METTVPAEVVQFVGAHIRSLGQLEVLLLVSALPDRGWTVAEVDAVVRSNPNAVLQWLEGFVQKRILIRSGNPPLYRFAPDTEALAQTVAASGAAYKMYRHRIVELIYARKPDSLLSFSEAFRFRRKD